MFLDKVYRGTRVGTATTVPVEIVRLKEKQKGIVVQPRRWVIERTLRWVSRCRKLTRDHEATPSSALAFFFNLRRRHDPRQAVRRSVLKRVLRLTPLL